MNNKPMMIIRVVELKPGLEHLASKRPGGERIMRELAAASCMVEHQPEHPRGIKML